jgi:hypothetical protein
MCNFNFFKAENKESSLEKYIMTMELQIPMNLHKDWQLLIIHTARGKI